MQTTNYGFLSATMAAGSTRECCARGATDTGDRRKVEHDAEMRGGGPQK
jgi:hypothetical protein